MKLFMILVSVLLPATVASPAPPSSTPCGWEGVGVTPEWQFTATGGADHHQWSSSSGMIRFDFDDDLICARDNGNPNGNGAVQGGRATWTMNLLHAADITLSMEGRAESQYETMTLKSDGVIETTVRAVDQPNPSLPGYCEVHSCDMCHVSMDTTTLHLEAGLHTLVVEVTTRDVVCIIRTHSLRSISALRESPPIATRRRRRRRCSLRLCLRLRHPRPHRRRRRRTAATVGATLTAARFPTTGTTSTA